MRIGRFGILTLGLAAIAVGVGGCGGSVAIPSLVAIRGCNAIADMPNATIGSGGSALDSGAFMTSGAYMNFNSSTATGFILLNTGVQVATATVDTTTGDHFTAFASNTMATPHLTVIKDDLSATPGGSGRYRFVNLSPAAGNIDVYVNAPAVDINTVGPSLSNVAFETVQAVAPAAGNYQIVITTAGTKTALISVNNTLKSGDIRTVPVVDNNGGGLPEQLFFLNDSGT